MRSELRWMFLLVGLVGMTASAGGSVALAQKEKTAETVDQYLARFFKTPAFAPLRQPDRVEALPVQIAGEGLSADFRVIEKPDAFDARTMRELHKTLLDTHSYGGASACMFTPGVALRFHKGAASIQAVICFKCGEVIFQDAAGRDLTGRLMLAPRPAATLARLLRR